LRLSPFLEAFLISNKEYFEKLIENTKTFYMVNVLSLVPKLTFENYFETRMLMVELQKQKNSTTLKPKFLKLKKSMWTRHNPKDSTTPRHKNSSNKYN
jgi:hypothetical protein